MLTALPAPVPFPLRHIPHQVIHSKRRPLDLQRDLPSRLL